MDEHTLNDLLECSVCLERLDTSSKVLPCQHTFCRKCLEVIICSHQELRCPECRILVDIKIDELPPNVLLMRILEGMKNATIKQQHPQQVQPDHNRHKSLNKQQHDKQIKADTNNLQQQPLTYQPTHQHQYLQYKNQQLPLIKNPNHNTQQPQSQHSQSSQPPRRCLLPHAYAIYDYKSTESTDLNFKKGDLLLLKRKIDDNWYVAQSNGIEGTFPINYVKVIVPLPTPQCIALYDFKMKPNEEEGCLGFKKDTVIHVLRRVDYNWAEGRIGNTIGIFPIAFVRLNALAEKILDINLAQSENQTSEQNSIPRMLPALPVQAAPTAEMNNLTSTSSSSTTTSTVNSNSSNSNVSSSNSSNNSSITNSHSSSMDNSPQHQPSQEAVQLRYRDNREKRHSLNALLHSDEKQTTKTMLQANRHSAEILSSPHDTTQAQSKQQQQQQQQPQQQQQQHSLNATQTRVNVLKTPVVGVQQLVPPSLPWGYLALYPYKPRKNDELELKRGCVYIVTERCLDGWFKGKNWQDTLGVFPGNYVTPLRPRDQKQLMHQWKHVPLVNMVPTTTISNNSSQPNMLPILQTPPPDIPPRHPENVETKISDIYNGSPPTSTTSCSSVWTKPLGHTVENFFNRSNHCNKPNDKSKDINKESQSTTSSSSVAVSLMKRLTNIKSRSKSPAANNISNPEDMKEYQNAAASTTTTNQISPQQLQYVHVRSGSCPSQILQSLPVNVNQQQTQNNEQNTMYHYQQQQQQQQKQHKQNASPTAITYGGSQRLKGNKERTNLQNMRQSIDANTFRQAYLQHSSQQQQQQQMPFNTNHQTYNHRKSQSLDANTMTSKQHTITKPHLPINTALDSTSTANNNSNSILIQNMRECRYRCIVPYPANSDIELELLLGDIIVVHRKQKNGWFKGTHTRTNKTGLFPASFVEPDDYYANGQM